MASRSLKSKHQQCSVSAHQPATRGQQRQPQPGAQPDKAENREGFDCEFVERPPEVLQSECPVCLQIIRDPYQVTCCGYSFCRSCIERIKADNKPCPTCNKKGFSDFPNKGLKRSLYAFKVRCSHLKDGCEWTGELGQLDVHLNNNPPPDKQLNGCRFTAIDCLYCEEKQQRQYIQVHQNEQCMKRPFSCEYCHDYESNFDDVIHNHRPVCGFHPVHCPNRCIAFPQRQNLDSHVAKECPLTNISCDFHHVGCAVKYPRKDMPKHLREKVLVHMSLLAASHARLQEIHTTLSANYAELQADCSEVKIENQSLKTSIIQSQGSVTKLQADCNQLKTENSIKSRTKNNQEHYRHEAIDNLKAERVVMKQELSVLRQKMKSKVGIFTAFFLLLIPLILSGMFIVHNNAETLNEINSTLQVELPIPSIITSMNGFLEYKKVRNNYAPPVYTHIHGYKICLRIYANGFGSGEGTHVSVYVYFMRGEFDDSLKWPFRGVISFRLLDHLNDEDNITVSLTYDNKGDDSDCSRVTEGERAKRGRGRSKLIAHNELEPKYLQKDSLLFQIHKVELH